jgi:hypothetical protein
MRSPPATAATYSSSETSSGTRQRGCYANPSAAALEIMLDREMVHAPEYMQFLLNPIHVTNRAVHEKEV